MTEIFLKQYKRIIFVVLLILSFILMTLDVQVSEDTSFLEKMIFELYFPVQQVVTWTFQNVSGFFNHYIFLVNLNQENEQLKKEVRILRKKFESTEKASKENYKLRSMLNFYSQTSSELLSADVLCRDSTKQFDSIFINNGSKNGIEYNMPVVTDNGVVGKVVKVSPHVSQVQTIVDIMSRISVKLDRTGEEGITKGSEGGLIIMDFVPSESSAQIDDILYTSGYGTIFPPDIEVGKVIEIKKEYKKMTKTLVIKPSVNFKETFRVFVIKDLNFKEIKNILEDEEK